MPCMKCANGKWKYGEKGKCQFDTLAKCQEAAAAIHAKPEKKEVTKDYVHPVTKFAANTWRNPND